MKYNSRKLLILMAMAAPLATAAQAQTAEGDNNDNKPVITYTANHPRYVLGGLTVDEMKGYDNDYLLNISGLNVGDTYEIPGPDISEAVRRYWNQKSFRTLRLWPTALSTAKLTCTSNSPHNHAYRAYDTPASKSRNARTAKRLSAFRPATKSPPTW